MNYQEASKLFKVSISAIERWYRRYKEKGNYQPKMVDQKIQKGLEKYVKAIKNQRQKSLM
jgi:transposase